MSPVLSPESPENASPGWMVLTSPRSNAASNLHAEAQVDDDELDRREAERERIYLEAEARKAAKREAAAKAKEATRAAKEAARAAERERLSRERQKAKKAGRRVKADPSHGDFVFGARDKNAPPRVRAEYKAAKIKRQTERRKAERAARREAERPEGHLSIDEALVYLTWRGVKRSKSGITKAIGEGRLEHVRKGRRIWIEPGALGRWVVEGQAAILANRKKIGERNKEKARLRRAS